MITIGEYYETHNKKMVLGECSKVLVEDIKDHYAYIRFINTEGSRSSTHKLKIDEFTWYRSTKGNTRKGSIEENSFYCQGQFDLLE